MVSTPTEHKLLRMMTKMKYCIRSSTRSGLRSTNVPDFALNFQFVASAPEPLSPLVGLVWDTLPHSLPPSLPTSRGNFNKRLDGRRDRVKFNGRLIAGFMLQSCDRHASKASALPAHILPSEKLIKITDKADQVGGLSAIEQQRRRRK